MKILLSEGYVLNSDAYAVWIAQLVKKQNGEGYYERVFNGYHGNLRNCLISFVKMRSHVSEAVTPEQLAEDMKHNEDMIREFCTSIDMDIRKRRSEE